MCVLPLAPVGLVGPVAAFASLEYKCGKFCTILIILLLYIPAVAIATPCYLGFVLLSGVMKLCYPNLSKGNDDFLGWISIAALMRITEIVTESCPQSMLGKFRIVCLKMCNSVRISTILFWNRYLHPAFSGPYKEVSRIKSSSICRSCSKPAFACKGMFRLVGKNGKEYGRANPVWDGKSFPFLHAPSPLSSYGSDLLRCLYGLLCPHSLHPSPYLRHRELFHDWTWHGPPGNSSIHHCRPNFV